MKKRFALPSVLIGAFAASTASASTFESTPAREDFIRMEIMSRICDPSPEELQAAGERIREAISQIGPRNGKVAFAMIDEAIWDFRDKPEEKNAFCEDAKADLGL